MCAQLDCQPYGFDCGKGEAVPHIFTFPRFEFLLKVAGWFSQQNLPRYGSVEVDRHAISRSLPLTGNGTIMSGTLLMTFKLAWEEVWEQREGSFATNAGEERCEVAKADQLTCR